MSSLQHHSNTQRFRLERKKLGLCYDCDKPVAIKPNGKPACYCPACQLLNREAAFEHYKDLRGDQYKLTNKGRKRLCQQSDLPTTS